MKKQYVQSEEAKPPMHTEEIPASTLLSLVRSGIMAPSADNHHHVLFELRPNGLRMSAGPGYLECRERHRRILTQLAFGCVLENVVLAANGLGYELDLDWNSDPGRPELLADIHLSRCENPQLPSQSVLADMISLRYTNRRFYGRQRLTEDGMLSLRAEVATQPGLELIWLEGDDRGRALRLARLAETERFRRKGLHEELFSAVRFDVGWQASCDQGIAPGSLEVESGIRRAFQMLRHWPLMRILNVVGAHYLVGFRAGYLPCKLAPHLGVIVIRGDIEANAVRAGRAFQRMWLRATALGASLQPMAASVILPFYDSHKGDTTEKLRNRLIGGWQEILGGVTPVMFFRQGYAPSPKIKSGRPLVERFLKTVDAPDRKQKRAD